MPRNDADLIALGAYIREQRTRLGLTQIQLADRVGWSQERISILESGKYGMPSLPGLVRLADALGVSTLDIIKVIGYPLMGSSGESMPAGRSGRAMVLEYTLHRLLAIDALTVREALTTAANQMALAMGADKIDAFTYDAPTNSLVALGTSDTPMGRLQHESGLERVPLANRERIAMVYETGEAFRTGDAQSDPCIARGVKETLGVQSIVAVPLRANTTVLGVLVAESSDPDRFSSDDQSFFVAVAQWIGLIAHRAELVESMRATVAEDARREAADELVTSLAHDLGNMLTPLRGRLSLLTRHLNRDGNERDLEHVEEATRAVARIEQLMHRLLDISRLDHGLFSLRAEPCDLAHLLQEFGEELRPAWPALVVQADGLPEVDGDPVRLREVLHNLLANAMHHSPPGAPIVLSGGAEWRDDGLWGMVSVRDQGPGIEAEHLPRVFDRFSHHRESDGLGLGLYLSRRLAEAHGGTLTVETAIGQGTTFCLAIPARRV
jgi:signal transduction histidine kinase